MFRHTTRRSPRPPRKRVLVRVTRPYLRRVPGLKPGPDYLSRALKAYSKVIQCHSRLAKLAPEFFDSGVVDRLAREREERRQWMESWRPALEKFYGPSTAPEPKQPSTPLPGPRTRMAVNCEITAFWGWLETARHAMHLHQRHKPRALPSLSKLVRLIKIASDLGRLATGSDCPLSLARNCSVVVPTCLP